MDFFGSFRLLTVICSSWIVLTNIYYVGKPIHVIVKWGLFVISELFVYVYFVCELLFGETMGATLVNIPSQLHSIFVLKRNMSLSRSPLKNTFMNVVKLCHDIRNKLWIINLKILREEKYVTNICISIS